LTTRQEYQFTQALPNQQGSGFGILVLVLPQATQTYRGAQLSGFRLLAHNS
jgi:hypothetical protein